MIGYTIPENLADEINALETLIGRHVRGEIIDAELKAHRVPFGIYEQRTKGSYMVRIRCAAGIVTPAQLRRIAEIAQRRASGRLHVTTRQELQIHDVALSAIVPVLRELLSVGLATRGGGGNTVRNITASWNAGIAQDEPFDVTPYAVELTSRLIARADSWLLPRKFKIAFSNGENDNALATVNDVGFVATIKNGARGFRVFVAGGMGRSPQPGHLLHEFAPERDVFEIAESVKQLFSRYGNRRNKHTARLRFLWSSLGRERFVEKYEEIRQELQRAGHAPFTVPADHDAPDTSYRDEVPAFADALWLQRYTGHARQNKLHWIRLPLALGDISASDAIVLSDVLEPFGPDCLRCTHDQNFVVRNVPASALDTLYLLLQRISPLYDQPPLLTNAVACAGASTCQLGICLSRGALAATVETLSRSGIDLDALGNFRLHLSGCPNSCGQHGIAHLGFHGKVLRSGTHAYPAYSVVAGAQLDGKEGSLLAVKIGDIPAKNVPKLTRDFLQHYASRASAFATYRAYLEAEGRSCLATLCDKFSTVPAYEADPTFYRDWGADSDFTLDGRGSGECASGLFDMVDIDLVKMRGLRQELEGGLGDLPSKLFELAQVAARALLVTRGVEVGSTTIFDDFERTFLDAGLISKRFAPLLKAIKVNPEAAARYGRDIVELTLAIDTLYASLDDTLQFHQPERDKELPQQLTVDLRIDLRGVACPMNFVKTKMALFRLSGGQVLEVLLDSGAPVENVPKSVAAEGHDIISQATTGDHWAVVIRKAG